MPDYIKVLPSLAGIFIFASFYYCRKNAVGAYKHLGYLPFLLILLGAALSSTDHDSAVFYAFCGASFLTGLLIVSKYRIPSARKIETAVYSPSPSAWNRKRWFVLIALLVVFGFLQERMRPKVRYLTFEKTGEKQRVKPEDLKIYFISYEENKVFYSLWTDTPGGTRFFTFASPEIASFFMKAMAIDPVKEGYRIVSLMEMGSLNSDYSSKTTPLLYLKSDEDVLALTKRSKEFPFSEHLYNLTSA
jgi:hypothetical protein